MAFSVRSALIVALLTGLLSGCQSLGVKDSPPESPDPTVSVESREQDKQADLTQADSTPPAPVERAKPKVYTDLWEYTRDNLSFYEGHEHERIEMYVTWFSTHPSYLKRSVQYANRYYYHVIKELEKAGLPLELALLPIVESGYDPFAYSSGRAAGPWQFIPLTGRHFGLKSNWWYDARRDILSSTEAALRYLKLLHKRFDGDWLLALAAYNAGGGTVSKAIRKNRKAGKPTDFWSLDLPRETDFYVPKLLAVARIIADPAAYNVVLEPIPNQPYFSVIKIEGQIDLPTVAKLAEISNQEIYLLNAGFRRWATDPSGPHRLLLPADRAEAVRLKIAALPADQRIRWTRHKVEKGDTLWAIAKNYRVQVAQLTEWNKLDAKRPLKLGQELQIWTQANAPAVDELPDRISNEAMSTRKVNYKVRKGDSLYAIADKFQVSVKKILDWNRLNVKKYLQPGQKLTLYVSPD